MSKMKADPSINSSGKGSKAQKLMDKTTDEMRLAREAMERTRRVRQKTAFLPTPPAYKKIY